MMLSLLLLLAVSAAPEAQPPSPKPLPPGVVQVQLDSLHCAGCAKQIARNLYKTPGVMRVRADLKRDVVWITAQPKKQLDLSRIWRATSTKDASPVRLRIGDRTFVAQDFEKAEKTANAAPAPAPRR